MDVTLPAGGVQLDALAVDGRLTVPPGLPEVKTTDNEQRAAGPIGGGGPTVTLRSKRGDINIKRKTETLSGSHFSLQTLLLPLQSSNFKLPTSDFKLQTFCCNVPLCCPLLLSSKHPWLV